MATQTKDKLTKWKAAKRHSAVLPSGFEIELELPDLPTLIQSGVIPNDLIEAALGAASKGNDKIDLKAIQDEAEFTRYIVAETVKEPAISREDVDDLPPEDKKMIAEFATRERDVDALGHHLGGLHTQKDWRTFRGIHDLDSVLEGTAEGR